MKKEGLWIYIVATLVISIVVILLGITIATSIYNNNKCNKCNLNSDKEVNVKVIVKR